MADANELKVQARRREAEGEYAKASKLYLQALSVMEQGNSLPDPSLLVRVADLEYRQGEEEPALRYYSKAVDEYADQGLITNAIAVCNKILRVFPGQVDCYRTLAELHLGVGLSAEARENLLRYVREAWDPEEPEPTIEAMREFLERSPDQDVCLRLASCLDEAGRTDEAVETLRDLWRERQDVEADVEALVRKARELDPEADLSDWGDGVPDVEPITDDAEDDSGYGEDADGYAEGDDGYAEGDDEPFDVEVEEAFDVEDEEEDWWPAGTEIISGPAVEGGWRPDAAGVPAGRPSAEGAERADEDWDLDHHPIPAFAAGAPPREKEGLELVAAFPDRLSHLTPPSNGGLAPEATEPPTAPEAPETPARGDTDAAPADDGPSGAAPADVAADEADTDDPVEDRVDDPADDHTEEPSFAGEERPMDEHERATDVATTEPDRWAGHDVVEEMEEAAESPGAAPEAAQEARREVDAGPAGRERLPAEEDLGEEAELRRGLDLLDELLEVQPDSLELRERKVRYARRLGDRDVLVDAYLGLAGALADEGSRRSARLLLRKVQELDPDNQRAEEGLSRLDIGELEEKRQAGKRAGAANATPRTATDEELAARRKLGLRLWTEFENAIREMPWLHAATQTYQAIGPDAAPPVEAFEMLGHYLLSRGRVADAADVLSRALELSDRSDEELADILYYLGAAHQRMGQHEEAREYHRRLEAVDADFARVRETVPDDELPDPMGADGDGAAR